jgi:hypothetical protein
MIGCMYGPIELSTQMHTCMYSTHRWLVTRRGDRQECLMSGNRGFLALLWT